MTTFIVALDLIMKNLGSGFDYEPLYAELETTNHYRLAENIWFVSVDGNLPEIGRELRDRLIQHIHFNDRVHLVPISDYYNYADVSIQKWLDKNVPRKEHNPETPSNEDYGV